MVITQIPGGVMTTFGINFAFLEPLKAGDMLTIVLPGFIATPAVALGNFTGLPVLKYF